jgi:amino acid adenylation domain-containing protein
MTEAQKADLTVLKKVSHDPFSSGRLESAVPTTEAQREIWATLALNKEATLCYNEALSIEISGDLDCGILNLAFQEVLKRHDALRSFFSADGKFFFIKEFSPQSISFVDFSLKPDAKILLEELKATQVSKKFDLTAGPCFEGTLVKFSDSQYYFLINAHHIICDGWSFAILLTEMTTIYSALKKNVQFSFDTAAQFADYAIEEKRHGLNHTQKQYWLKQFAKPLAVKKIPLDFSRPAYRTYDSQRLDFEVPESVVKVLKKFGASQGSSFYTVLMSAFQVLLSKLTHSSELVVGMASATQSATGQHDLIGHLVNLLPLRSEINQELKLKEFIKILRSQMLDAFEHQQFSFGSLLKELNITRDPSEIPLVNIVFNIDQQTPDQGMRFDGLSARYSTIPRQFENFELFINAVSCENKLVLECQYNVNLFKASTIENWFHCYISLLENLSLYADTTLGHIPIPGLYFPKVEAKTPIEAAKVLPRNPKAEDKLLGIWKKVLELPLINVQDNFFSLGGHSLLVIEMIPLIEKEFSQEVSAREIFENPTIHKLASKLAGPQVVAAAAAEKIPKLPEQSTYPVTHNQMQVWYLEQMYRKTVMHNLPSSIRIKFAVDRAVMEKTLHYLTRRHSALRTTIVVEEGIPVQKVLNADLPQFTTKLELIPASEATIVSLLNKEAEYVFDTQKAPMFQAKLYQLGSNDFVFYFMAHHAVWDGWSFDIFFEELNTIYSAMAVNAVPHFAKNPEVSYGDFSLWLHQSVESGKFQNQLDFWKQKLKAPLPVLELHSDYKRPLVATHEGLTFPFQLKAEQMDNLRTYAKKQGTSVFNVILAAFKVTLARHSSLDDIIVGSPVRARNSSELMNTIGYFVNTVALRTNIELNRSFEQILKEVARTCIEAFDHQTLPFQMVLNNVDHPRDPSRTPIFQTFFSYQDVSNREAVLNGVPYTQINIDKGSIHTDLDLWIKASDKKIEGAFEFRKDLFKMDSIKRFYECFVFLIDSLNLNENIPLIKRSILPESQSQLILKDWNSTTTQDQFLPLHKMFEASVAKFPKQLAIQNDKGSLSYEELNHKANKVAQGLIALGVTRGDLVGLSLNRDLNMLVSILGILKTGAGYVPLDPAFPQDRLNYMIKSSQPKVLVTESSLQKRFENGPKSVLVENILADYSISTLTPKVETSLSDTVYIIYTSGSTGDPKGVQISHGALANFLISMSKAPGMAASDKVLAVTTLSFDIATLELYLPLITGASLYLASGYDVIDGKALKNIIEKNQVNVMQATPSTWRLLLASGWNGGKNFKILCGGEPFPKDLATKLISLCGSVWNMYGPTETTVWSTCHKLEANLEFVSIGKPIDNTFTYILDEGLNLAPIGAAGQLYIGGVGLAEGYYKQPDLTAEKFIANPFKPGQKMYATGDFARFDEKGELECLGRQDGQVKVRGYRIELGEIETAISKIDSFKSNAVITKEVRAGDVRIIAFLVSSPGKEFNEAALREVLNQRLPKYMVPSHFVLVDQLPQTLNGKIDKKTLGTMFTETKPLEAEVVQPASADNIGGTDADLRKIWQQVLGLPKINDGDNFFSIGGNSLLAVQLFSQIAKKFSLNLPLSILLETIDFKSFAEAVRLKLPSQVITSTSYTSLVPIKPTGTKNPVFSFHGVGGNVLNYVSLIPALDQNRPLVGVQSVALNQDSQFYSIEEMAAAYLREIKSYQPVGPYFLAGGSMGGIIALEVAQQLKARGEVIEKLVMFDTFGPRSNMKDFDIKERTFIERVMAYLKYRKRVLLHKLQTKLFKVLGMAIPLELRLFQTELNNYQALWNYKPVEYSGDLDLIRAHLQPTGWYSDPHMGWGKIIQGQIRTYEIAGSHSDFIESPELGKVFTKLI